VTKPVVPHIDVDMNQIIVMECAWGVSVTAILGHQNQSAWQTQKFKIIESNFGSKTVNGTTSTN